MLGNVGVFILLVYCVSDYCSADGRWSRQLSTQSVSDWVPVQPSSKRQVSPRVLNQPAPFQSSFFPAETAPNNYAPQEAPRQLYLQSIPAGQSIYTNQQNAPNQPFVQLALTDPQQYNPLQTFIPTATGLQFSAQRFPQIQQSPLSLTNINNQIYNQQKAVTASQQQQKPFKQDGLRYIDGYKLENVTSDIYQNSAKKKPTTVNPKLKQESIGKPILTNNQRATERSSASSATPTSSTVTTVEKEEVQLLYVPLETLENNKFDAKHILKQSQKHEALRDSIGSPGQINNQLYGSTTPNYSQRQQTQLHNIQQDLIQQAFNAQNFQGKTKQSSFDRQPKYQSSSTVNFPFTQSLYPSPVLTTPRSKKLKAHQPPLAVYMQQKSQEKAKLTDVLGLLKQAKSISVLDNVDLNSPKVFVGPSNLRVPSDYVKFDLPYLSGIDGSRIQRNIDNLPFFVAPLSYKAPEGFAKIPFPAPHVGSVIINPFMGDSQYSRPDSVTGTYSSSFGINAFQQSPSTESFGSTLDNVHSQKLGAFNYFSSVTPNPTIPPQNTVSYQTTFSPFEQQTFKNFRPMPTNRRPEGDINTSRSPLTSYFTPPPSKPTVSYFSFTSPEYSSPPITTPKYQTPLNYEYRGHYITNSAIDNGLKTTKNFITTEKIQTTQQTPTTQSSPAFLSHNPYNINQAFQSVKDRETNDIKNSKAVKTKEYSSEAPVTENAHYSSIGEFTSSPYFGSVTTSRPIEYESSSPVRERPIHADYSPKVNEESPYLAEQIENNEQYGQQYLTESPTTNEITTSTTTTSTTTTPAPTTTSSVVSRRPIHLRGRPRYTTQKPQNDDQVSRTTTTRKTPTRRPNTFRSRYESAKSTTTESSTYEASKTTRYTSNRNKQPEDDAKSTTESSLPKTSAATRIQRLRSRGKAHFKPSDNYEGSDYVVKKHKKNDEGESIAYQRDVLHQNYPVTLTEKKSTLEIRTSTPMPSSRGVVDLADTKIKIYETTGVTQKPHEPKQSEFVSEYYDNQPVFQGQPQKFLDQADSYVEINGENTFSTPTPNFYESSKEITGEKILDHSVKHEEKTDRLNIRDSMNVEPEKAIDFHKTFEDSPKEHAATSTEIPIVRFRNKLKTRPKILKDDTYSSTSSSLGEKIEENTEVNFGSTRRSSVNLQPVTYRPTFDRRRTTMRIEDIEAELKSNRQQLQSDSRSTTFKYPVYIPEASTKRPSQGTNLDETVETTTKRNHFVRRRPVRPTQSNSVPATVPPRSIATTQATDDKQQNKKIRVRGRVRTRPTAASTETPDEDQKPVTQRYNTRNRQPAQKHFKRPTSTDKIDSQETVEDQASYDSISRPEYVEYSPKKIKEDQYNPEAGKAESHWSPKLSHNSFQPIFNPNVIADEIKSDGSEFGTKLPSMDDNTEKSEIITARNSYDDVLIPVTPATNKWNEDKPTDFLTSLFEGQSQTDSHKPSDDVSSFESVLEEVMRKLELQDEDEYSDNYDRNVMKHEGGEIGEIPPENANQMTNLEESNKIEARISTSTESEEFAKNERQGRRRGVWRRVKVRPVNKDVFQTAESQFYGNSANDLIKEKSDQSTNNIDGKKIDKKKYAGILNNKPEINDDEVQITTAYPSSEEFESKTEITDNPENEDFTMGSPDTEIPIVKYDIDNTQSIVDKAQVTIPELDDSATTYKTVEFSESAKSNISEDNITQRSIVTEISKDQSKIPTTTETQMELITENRQEAETTTATESIDDLLNLTNIETTQSLIFEEDEKQKSVLKTDQVETTTLATNFWDPKNIISTSMSTEISHETEICYRGKCVKTKKQDLKKVLP